MSTSPQARTDVLHDGKSTKYDTLVHKNAEICRKFI